MILSQKRRHCTITGYRVSTGLSSVMLADTDDHYLGPSGLHRMVILASYLHLPAEISSIETFARQITITLRCSSYGKVGLNS